MQVDKRSHNGIAEQSETMQPVCNVYGAHAIAQDLQKSIIFISQIAPAVRVCVFERRGPILRRP